MSNTHFEERAAQTLRDIEEAGTRKRLRHVTGPMGPTVQLEDAGELNHASIIDSCRLARPLRRGIYKHRDFDDLRAKLKVAATEAELTWVITDGVFSMEGSVADLKALVELCREFGAMLVVDDSHGVGALGPTGKGTAEFWGVWGEMDVVTGTLGKALGGACPTRALTIGRI